MARDEEGVIDMAEKLNADDATRPNDPESIFKQQLSIILPLQGEFERLRDDTKKAQARYRAAIKAAKSAGVNNDALLEFLRLRKEDPQEVTQRFHALNQMMMWGDLPIGSQLGLFEDGKSVATKIEDRVDGKKKTGAKDKGPAREKGLSAVEADGYEAGMNGKANDGGGYDDGSPAFLRWSNGWVDGQSKIAADMGTKTNGSKKPAGRAGGGLPEEENAGATA
jgi:uncharacterized protein (UPF0335 family)/ribosome modulation factor